MNFGVTANNVFQVGVNVDLRPLNPDQFILEPKTKVLVPNIKKFPLGPYKDETRSLTTD